VLELQGHGGPVVLQMLLARVLEAGREHGLRLAEPGEFTRRAFLNDKLDLAQAEAVADLIDASTEAAAKSASQSLSGAFSKVVHGWSSRPSTCACWSRPRSISRKRKSTSSKNPMRAASWPASSTSLEHVFRQAAQGALLREGLNVVLVGQPNVGKSSLLNALAGADVAIVTPIAGTTRDKVSETIQIEGIPLNIIDTAGIRAIDEGIDVVERIGIERTWGEVGKADVILHLLDANLGPSAADETIVAAFPAGVPVVRIWNKIDLSGHKASVEGARMRRISTCRRTKARHRPAARGTAAHRRLAADRRIAVPGARTPPDRAARGAPASRHGGCACGAGRPVARPVRRRAAAGAGPAVEHHRASSRRTICWG
jgi:tRNA modification GTPase